MAVYRKIDCRISNDKKFRSLSLEARYAWFYILTKKELAPIGAFSSSIEALAFEQGSVQYLSEKESLTESLSESLSLDMTEIFKKAFLELLEKGLILYDKTEQLIYIPNFLKYNLPESPNVIKSWNSAIDSLPECNLRDYIFARSAEFIINNQSDSFKKALPEEFIKAYNEGYAEGFGKGLPKALPNTLPNQEQEQEHKQEQILLINKSDSAEKEEIEEKITSSEDSLLIFDEQEETEQKPKAAVKTKSKSRTHKFDLEELPEKWREYCQIMRADLDPERTFIEFKFYYTQGNGQDVLRSDKGWSQCWQGWLRRHQQTKNQFLDNPNAGTGTTVPSNNSLAENCPQDKIIACYHEVLPNHPPVLMWNTEKRINQLRNFWRSVVIENEITEEQKGLNTVKWVFEKVKYATSLNGQNENGYRADLEFITSEDKLPRIIEGYYDKKPQQHR
jgi:hypothetical protein